jgi:hypothetical protein
MSEPHNEQSTRSALDSRVWKFLAIWSALWALCALWAFSNVRVDPFVFLGVLLWGSALAALWTITLCCLIVLRLRSPRRIGRLRARNGLIILATPALGVLGVFLLWTDLDFLLRLKLSERALIAHCESVIADPERANEPRRRIGLFRVYAVDVVDADAVRVTTVLPGIFDEAGVYYDPGDVLAEHRGWPEDRLSLFGPWDAFYFRD